MRSSNRTRGSEAGSARPSNVSAKFIGQLEE
jgi:hypothetical protein